MNPLGVLPLTITLPLATSGAWPARRHGPATFVSQTVWPVRESMATSAPSAAVTYSLLLKIAVPRCGVRVNGGRWYCQTMLPLRASMASTRLNCEMYMTPLWTTGTA